MARKKTRRRRDQPDEYPAWLWMLFGLSIGLAVAFAVYVNDRTIPEPARTAAAPAAEPVPRASEEAAANTEQAATPPEPRFDFYKMLPNYEVVIVEQEPDVTEDDTPQAIVEPGEYVLQAGSFSSFDDADRRRAELALHGIESSIQRVSIDNRRYHRVWIGPTKDLSQLNTLRTRLRQANIDVLRIRLGD